jgi:hypothetical protein
LGKRALLPFNLMVKLMKPSVSGSKIIPTAAQLLKCFLICYELTRRYLPIYIVRVDERTRYIYILAGEQTEFLIEQNGDLVDEHP